jgi:glycosyltransferase involved in cell wall biosynthesis
VTSPELFRDLISRVTSFLTKRGDGRKLNMTASDHKLAVAIISGEPSTPGHVYRVQRLASAIQRLGHSAVVVSASDIARQQRSIASSQLIFIWRTPWSPILERLVDAARSTGAKLIFDVDDHMLDPGLARTDAIDGIRTLGLASVEVVSFYTKILQTFVKCDAGLAPTDYLAHVMRAHQKPVITLPNGFDREALFASRLATRRLASVAADDLIRIGYAGGTRTHQRDFASISQVLARLLREKRNVRLVLFQHEGKPIVDLTEFPELLPVCDQIELHDLVPLQDLPEQLARFSINVAPLEVGNAFCEAKSELKYFEAALVNVPTVASPTEPFRSAIQHNVTGLLAQTTEDWYGALSLLISDANKRQTIGRNAYHDVLWRYGPERRLELVSGIIDQLYHGGARATRSFQSTNIQHAAPPALPRIVDHRIIAAKDQLGHASTTVVVPLYNYAEFIEETFESVYEQNIDNLDLVIVEDQSTDRSLEVAAGWVERKKARFNRVVLAQTSSNSGLAASRNVGVHLAETDYFLPLDADNCLLSEFVGVCSDVLEQSSAAFAFPEIQTFGDRDEVIGTFEFIPARFIGGNYIDAMALVRKSAWAAVGGYDDIPFGWEDYDFWCKCVEAGLWGRKVPQILAKYRAHGRSMLINSTDVPHNKLVLMKELEQRHPWIRLQRP